MEQYQGVINAVMGGCLAINVVCLVWAARDERVGSVVLHTVGALSSLFAMKF